MPMPQTWIAEQARQAQLRAQRAETEDKRNQRRMEQARKRMQDMWEQLAG
jgi:hypothetical protein